MGTKTTAERLASARETIRNWQRAYGKLQEAFDALARENDEVILPLRAEVEGLKREVAILEPVVRHYGDAVGTWDLDMYQHGYGPGRAEGALEKLELEREARRLAAALPATPTIPPMKGLAEKEV